MQQKKGRGGNGKQWSGIHLFKAFYIAADPNSTTLFSKYEMFDISAGTRRAQTKPGFPPRSSLPNSAIKILMVRPSLHITAGKGKVSCRQADGAPSMLLHQTFSFARGYVEQTAHHQNFYRAVRERTPVVEDPVLVWGAAGPALMSNISYFEKR